MNMLKQAFELWKSEKRHKGTTLQRRLILFFASVTIFLVLAFALLLLIFGINGKGEKAARDYMTSELSHVSEAVSNDFGRLSLLGIDLSGSISKSCDSFFAEQNISAEELSEHPELLELLISKQMPFLTTAMNSNTCSGVFLLLDATVNPSAENADTARAGFYLRATQPLSSQTVGAKNYCLRGPAQVARDNGIELLGQWKMEYDITGEDFFSLVMETARDNETLPLSRLYYWTGRVTLHGNSEAGFLLCVPLRSDDGSIFGVCGIEVSDRMFKQLYSPQESDYKDVFAIAAPSASNVLQSSQGLIAGNSFLTGQRMTEDLICTGQKNGFYRFCTDATAYGGLIETVKLYPTGSPYVETELSVAVLMPEELLNAVIKGNSAYLFLIIVVLLIASLTASVVISHRYLRPVKKALHSIQNKEYDTGGDISYLEINDLFDFLAEKDTEHEEAMRLLDEQRRGALSEAEQAKQQAERLATKRREEIDRDSYALFLEKLKTLTPKEREVFHLYLDGKSAKEIVVLLNFSENALKYHNKNIYSKLGVASRKELLMYAALMKQDKERTDKA